MANKRKLLIVGAGGIGSWLAFNIHNSIKHNQLTELIIDIYDDDTVDVKNIGYQNFSDIDLLESKAEAISIRYGLNSFNKRVDSEDILKKYDCIVSCVDNSIFRKLLFNYVFNNEQGKESFWIDLRSEGTSVAGFTKNDSHTYESMLATLPDEDVLEGSCQLQWELENGIIQNGNKIIAAIGAQYILNWYRGDYSPHEFIMRF